MDKNDEKVLVVKSEILFAKEKWQGLKTDNLEYYLDLINNNYEFKRRGDVEEDDNYQQIIPYILFNYQNKYFLYRYLKKAGEQRLKNDYILGVGGHINQVDIKNEESVLEVGRDREWNEEVSFHGNLDKKLIGILNDNRRPVEAVHLGLVYLFTGDNPNISVKETDKIIGEMFDIKEIGEKVVGTEGWAPIIYNEYLKNLK